MRDGITAAMEMLSLWYDRCQPMHLEPTGGFAPSIPRKEPRAASLLSGGIDALALLRGNRLDYPASHPNFIRDCIVLRGANLDDQNERGLTADRLADFESHVSRMTTLADSAGVTLIPMYTNIRSFCPPPSGWQRAGFAAGLVSTAQCLRRRIDRVEFASAGLVMRHRPAGSQPWLDHHYSTEAVSVRHGQPALSRFDKLRMISDWPEAMAVLRVCPVDTLRSDGRVNCGECEKCVRTMLALVALGKLDSAPTFPFDDVTPAMLEPHWIDDENTLPYYTECLDALVARERSDLAAPVRRKTAESVYWRKLQKVLRLLRPSRW